jgi:hypothetical protein
MVLNRDDYEAIVRATCAPKIERRTFGQWLGDNAVWLFLGGWGVIVVALNFAREIGQWLEGL